MNRRDFGRRLLAMFAAGAVLDPEYLLWKPKSMVTVPAMPIVPWPLKDRDTGIAIRFIQAWDPKSQDFIHRFDAWIGYPDLTPNPTVLLQG